MERNSVVLLFLLLPFSWGCQHKPEQRGSDVLVAFITNVDYDHAKYRLDALKPDIADLEKVLNQSNHSIELVTATFQSQIQSYKVLNDLRSRYQQNQQFGSLLLVYIGHGKLDSGGFDAKTIPWVAARLKRNPNQRNRQLIIAQAEKDYRYSSLKTTLMPLEYPNNQSRTISANEIIHVLKPERLPGNIYMVFMCCRDGNLAIENAPNVTTDFLPLSKSRARNTVVAFSVSAGIADSVNLSFLQSLITEWMTHFESKGALTTETLRKSFQKTTKGVGTWDIHDTGLLSDP